VTAALLRQTRTIPIVFTVVSDPVGERFVESLARPGGNATGFTNVEFSLTGKWLELLKEVAPGVKRVAFIFNPKLAPGGGSYYTRLIEASAPSFAIKPTVVPVSGTDDLEHAIDEFASEPNGGLVVLPDATTLVNRKLIVALADRRGVPAIYAFRIVVTEDGWMSYGIDVLDQYRQAAGYVDRILKGAKPAELPVQLPAKFVMSINLKRQRGSGWTCQCCFSNALTKSLSKIDCPLFGGTKLAQLLPSPNIRYWGDVNTGGRRSAFDSKRTWP
jgi:putative tryptophan/tyrosine transport system substrate-binding protein